MSTQIALLPWPWLRNVRPPPLYSGSDAILLNSMGLCELSRSGSKIKTQPKDNSRSSVNWRINVGPHLSTCVATGDRQQGVSIEKRGYFPFSLLVFFRPLLIIALVKAVLLFWILLLLCLCACLCHLPFTCSFLSLGLVLVFREQFSEVSYTFYLLWAGPH